MRARRTSTSWGPRLASRNEVRTWAGAQVSCPALKKDPDDIGSCATRSGPSHEAWKIRAGRLPAAWTSGSEAVSTEATDSLRVSGRHVHLVRRSGRQWIGLGEHTSTWDLRRQHRGARGPHSSD